MLSSSHNPERGMGSHYQAVLEQFQKSLVLWPQLRAPNAISALHAVLGLKAPPAIKLKVLQDPLPENADTSPAILSIYNRAIELHRSRAVRVPESELIPGIKTEWHRNMNAAAFLMLGYIGEPHLQEASAIYSQENIVLNKVDAELIGQLSDDSTFTAILRDSTEFFFKEKGDKAFFVRSLALVLSDASIRDPFLARNLKWLNINLRTDFDVSTEPVQIATHLVNTLRNRFLEYIAKRHGYNRDYSWLTFGVGLPRKIPSTLVSRQVVNPSKDG